MSGNVRLVRFDTSFENRTVMRIAEFFGFHRSLSDGSCEINEGHIKAAGETLGEWLVPPSELYVIISGDCDVGFIRLSYRGSNVAWIEDIFVDKEHRGCGIASCAVGLAEDMIRSDPNYTAVCIDAVPRNSSALRLYRRLGYDTLSIVTLRKDFGGNDRDRTVGIDGVEFKY